jgi:hypothetical protein
MTNPGRDFQFNDTPDASGKGSAGSSDLFAAALMNELVACQGMSNLAPVLSKEPMEAATRKTQTEYMGLPIDASDKAMCTRQAEIRTDVGREAVGKFMQGLDKGDVETINSGVLNMHQFSYPFVERAEHDNVDNLLNQRGLGHSWSKDGDLSIFKENGQTTTIATLNGMNATALQVEQDDKGHIIKATPEQPSTAVRDMLAR